MNAAPSSRANTLESLILDELKAKAELDRQVEDVCIEVEQNNHTMEKAKKKAVTLQHRLQAYQEQSSKLQRSITEKRLALSPILHIPGEILEEVFKWWSEELWGTGEDDLWTRSTNQSNPIAIAVRVCKSWNETATNCPGLWAKLGITVGKVSIEGVKRWLEHSKRQPLHLELDACDLKNTKALQDVLALLLPEAKRCVSIGSKWDGRSMARMLGFFQVPFPALKSLSLRNLTQDRHENERFSLPRTFLPHAPRITHCYLLNTPFPTSTPQELRKLSFIVNLEHTPISTDGIERIGDLPHLQQLYLRLPDGEELNWACPPDLQLLVCTARSLLQVRAHEGQPLFPPSLKSLEYYVFDGGAALVRALQDNPIQLVWLGISGSALWEEAWRAILASQPLLESLSLTDYEGPSVLHPLVMEPWLCPRLRNITFSSCQELDGEDVIEFLSVRRAKDMPTGLERLEKCTVEECAKVTEFHHSIIKEWLEMSAED